VLEGTRSGLRALGHLLSHPSPVPPDPPVRIDNERRARWCRRLTAGPLAVAEGLTLLADYGIEVAAAQPADHEGAVLAAASAIGYPLVLKTDEDIAHKTDVGGVAVGLADDAALLAAYRDMADRLGPRVVVCRQVAPGVEVLVGAVRDPSLGMVLVVGAGGVLVEYVADRVAALPPVGEEHARALLGRTLVERLLVEPRHGEPADVTAVATAIASLSKLVLELDNSLDAVEVNPLMCGPHGAVAVDVHVEKRAEPGPA
jgi:acetate---CoA ligase (ADP-forming)